MVRSSVPKPNSEDSAVTASLCVDVASSDAVPNLTWVVDS